MTYAWRTNAGGAVEVDKGDGLVFPTLDLAAPGISARVSRVNTWATLSSQIGGAKGVPLAWVLGFIFSESAGYPNAVSQSVGARGLMQVLPSTAKNLGFDPDALFDPATNIAAGTTLLADFRKDGFDLPSSASMYNAGPSKLHPGPKTSTKSPWGIAEDPGYISNVVSASNYYHSHSPSVNVAGPTSSLGLLALFGVGLFAFGRGRA
jgi:soluble lytic murein transglycosylase-like protein